MTIVVISAVSGDRSYGSWRIEDDVQGEWRREDLYSSHCHELSSLLKGLEERHLDRRNVIVVYFGRKMTVDQFEFEQKKYLTI